MSVTPPTRSDQQSKRKSWFLKFTTPVFQGIWKPRKIPNPAYFEDLQPFRMMPFSALGLELWSMTSDIFFDNFLITDDRNTADRWANDGWGLKKSAESAAEVRFHEDHV